MPINRSRILPALTLCAIAAVPATASAKPKAASKPVLPKLQTISPLATAMPGARVPVRTVLRGKSGRARRDEDDARRRQGLLDWHRVSHSGH